MAAFALACPVPLIAAEPVMERAARERPNLVLLDAVEGLLPSDSSEAGAFRAGVREAFEPDLYLTERVTGGFPRVSMALANRFRWVNGDPFGDGWHVRVTLAGWSYGTDKEITVIRWIRRKGDALADARPGTLPEGEGDSTRKR